MRLISFLLPTHRHRRISRMLNVMRSIPLSSRSWLYSLRIKLRFSSSTFSSSTKNAYPHYPRNSAALRFDISSIINYSHSSIPDSTSTNTWLTISRSILRRAVPRGLILTLIIYSSFLASYSFREVVSWIT